MLLIFTLHVVGVGMSSIIDNDVDNKRVFPRIRVTCPVLYRLDEGMRWQVARLLDFSATGICMICDDNLPINTNIDIQIKPGSQKTVPELSVSGFVVRSVTTDEQRFEISCKVLKVHR